MESFFVSYNQADRQWAEWIAWQLEDAGYLAFIQAWDIRPGTNFVVAMQGASEGADRFIAVLSEDYLKAKFTQPEWAAAFTQDPAGERGILVPVRVGEVDLRGMWIAIVYIDLVGLTKEEAKRQLLSGVKRERSKPPEEPSFPGKASQPAPPSEVALPAPPSEAAPPAPSSKVGPPAPLAKLEPAFPVSKPIDEDPFSDWAILDAEITADGAISFLFRSESTRVTDLRRVNLTSNQRALVEASMQGGRFFMTAGQQIALFQLLIPDSFKAQLGSTAQICLVLDRETAAFPWEMLREPEQSPDAPPFAVRAVVIRRPLATTKRRAKIKNSGAITALVVGEPNPFETHAPRPGAAFEAQAVANIVQNSAGARVQILVGRPAHEIINTLFANRYSLVHIAAGFDRLGSGLLIGDGLVLGGREFEQMREVPEMVFVNCGHLGVIDTGEAEVSKSINRFAADFAYELLHSGVRAVIITGWAVDDSASVTFVSEFYDTLLSGESLPEAMRKARKATFERHSHWATWGAFQCYCDPDFYLVES